MQQVQEVTGTEKMQPLKLLAEPYQKGIADTFSMDSGESDSLECRRSPALRFDHGGFR